MRFSRSEKRIVIKYLCKFKDKFKSPGEAESFYDNLPELIKEFISIPVFLYFMVATYEKAKPVEIRTPGELIGQYEDFLCGARESRPLDLDEDYRTRLIPSIAFNMCQNNETDIHLKYFNEYIHQYNKDNYSSIDEREIKDIVTNRFKLMKVNEKGELRFILQILRDYFAAVYMKVNAFSPEEILNRVYTDTTRNNDLVNAVRLLAGIVKPEIAKSIIHKFIEKDLYLTCDMFAWSSITTYEEEFIELISTKIHTHSREYLLNLNEVVFFYLKVLALLQKAGRLHNPISADYMRGLGIVYRNKLNYDQAIKAYKKAIKIYEKNNMQTHLEYARCHMNLGITYWNKLDYGRAIEVYTKATSIYEKNQMQAHPDYAHCLINFGLVYANKLDYDRAIELYKNAIEIFEKNQLRIHPAYAHCYMNLGEAYCNTGKKGEAIQSLELALSVFEKTVGKNHPDYQECFKKLDELR